LLATPAFWDFGWLLTLKVPWLFRLALDTAGTLRYLNSLAAAAASHAVLFGSPIAGRSFSRSAQARAVSLLGGRPR
jgi:hypothetical protein